MTRISSVANVYEGISTFYLPTEGTYYSATVGDVFTGIKAQPYLDMVYANSFRFEKGQDVIGYVYWPNGSGSQKWKDEKVNLANFATVQQAASAMLTLGFLAFAAF